MTVCRLASHELSLSAYASAAVLNVSLLGLRGQALDKRLVRGWTYDGTEAQHYNIINLTRRARYALGSLSCHVRLSRVHSRDYAGPTCSVCGVTFCRELPN